MFNFIHATRDFSVVYLLEGRSTPNRSDVMSTRSLKTRSAKLLPPGHASTQGAQEKQPVVSHEDIARRAQAIWEKKGRPADQDEANWHEAEAQLLAKSRAF
jgi:hypothetical protein